MAQINHLRCDHTKKNHSQRCEQEPIASRHSEREDAEITQRSQGYICRMDSSGIGRLATAR